MDMSLVAAAVTVAVCCLPARAIRVWDRLPDPASHPLRNRSKTAGADWPIFSPIRGKKLPGWAALRVKDTDLEDLEALWLTIDKYLGNDTAHGEFDCANALWPSSRIVFHPNFTAFAATLKARHIPIVDLGGYGPASGSQIDVNADDGSTAGGAIGFSAGSHAVKPWNGAGATSYIEQGKASEAHSVPSAPFVKLRQKSTIMNQSNPHSMYD